MVYAPQRRHAVSSITLLLHTTGFVQYLHSPNFLVLLSRALVQQQIIAAPALHPARSLFGLAFMLTALNLMAALLHWLDFLSGMNGSKGMILDFIGPSKTASMTRILLLDLIIYLGQLVTLMITFVVGHAHSIPSSDSFPYPDVLLPPTPPSRQRPKEIEDDEDDVESGLKQRRRRGFQSAYEELDTEESPLWLNDDEGPGAQSTRTRSDSASGGRQRDPPVVFSLTLPHIFHLVFSLPNPAPPPEAYAGGTPNPTPPVTPGVESTSPLLRHSPFSPLSEVQPDRARTIRDTVSTVDDDGGSRTMPGEFRPTSRDTGSSV